MNLKEKKIKTYRIILLVVEVLLVMKLILSFMQPRLSRTFFVEDMSSSGAIVVELDGKGWYVDNSIELEKDTFLRTVPINLSKGVYKIFVHHQVGGNGTIVNLNSDNISYRLIAGRQNMRLDGSSDTTEYEIILNEDQEGFNIDFQYTGDGYAWISSVDIMQTWNMERLHAMYGIAFIILVELIWNLIKTGRIRRILLEEASMKSIVTGLLISVPVILATLPCISYYVIEGFDLNFHLMRIEGIAEAIKNGCFPVRIQTNWLNGYGYPVSIFYGDMLLYFPAVLRVMGMSLQEAYKWFLFSINVLTALTMYFAAKGITDSRKMGIIASYLYLLLPYRLSCIYTRSGVGEYSAMAFFPLIIWGIYRIYTEDIKTREWKSLWLISTIGFTGVIESHLLSTVLAGIFTVLCCMILYKKTFQKERIVELIKVVLTTIMVNVTYLIPLLDYMQKEYKVSNSAQNASIQTQGAFFAQIFSLLPVGDGVSLSVVENLSNPNEITVSLGLVAWIGIGLFLVYILFDLRKRVLDLGDHIERNTVYLLFAMSMIAILVSTIVFPWDTFGEKLGTFKSIFTSIQFPWRYLSVASVFLVFGIVVIINSDIFQQDLLSLLGGGQQYINILCIGILSVVLVIAGNFTSKEITGGNYSYLIAACDLDDKKIMGAEYIPLGVNEDILLDLQEPEAKGTLINGYEVNNRDICLDLSQADGEGNVSVPRIYYKGYKVKLDNIKGWKNCYSDEVGRVYFQVPEGYEGQAVVRFVEPWYWRSAEIISLITVIAIGCWAHKRRKY